MPSVAQVLSPGFARTWHEAVAIVQEAAHQLHEGFGLPAAADIEIEESGALTFGFGDESSGNPVTALATLLQQLLEGVEAPQSLRDLASENAASSPAHATIASFSQALAFFERPNRSNDLRAVAGRLRSVREKSTADQEFERLREKVAHAPEPEQKKKTAEKRPPKLSKAQQAIAVAAVFALVFGTLGYRAGLHRNLGSMTAGIEGAIQNVVGAGLETFGVSRAASASENPVQPENEPLEKERDPGRTNGADRAAKASMRAGGASGSRPGDRPQRTARASSPAPTPPSTSPFPAAKPSTASATTAATSPAKAPAASAASAAAAAPRLTVTPGDGAIFSEEHPQVQAPVLVRPQLPKEPAPGDDTGIFDMLIDENGDVMQVKLISPRRRYHDRMLVAAAKAWKFRPAMLNGFPVKYRIRIPIILKGMP